MKYMDYRKNEYLINSAIRKSLQKWYGKIAVTTIFAERNFAKAQPSPS